MAREFEFNEEQLDGLIQQTQEDKDNRPVFSDLTSFSFLKEGTIRIRFTLESYQIGDKKRIRIYRKTRSHKYKLKSEDGKMVMVHRRCTGTDDCHGCTQAQRLDDVKHREAFKYRTQENAVFSCCVYEANVEKSEYLKADPTKAQFLVGDYKFIRAVEDFITSQDARVLNAALNPNTAGREIEITIVDRKIRVGFGFDDKKLPEIPDDHPSTDDVFLDESIDPSPEEKQYLEKEVSRMIQQMTSIQNPRNNAKTAGNSQGDISGLTGGNQNLGTDDFDDDIPF